MVFYRKYRPQTLDEIDNIEVSKRLTRLLSQDEPPHAFLFTGPKGTGKTSAARIIAKCINCTRKKYSACGKCDTCISIGKGENLDILEIDAASNRGIDEIRSLKDAIKLSPLSLQFKVYIIDEVHMLTKEAFNALLKTLEEPPKHAVFILATTEPEKLLDTIVSRCVHIQFSKASIDEIVASLNRIAKGEKIISRLDSGGGVLKYIANIADGSFRDAAKLLEQAVLHSKNKSITLEIVASLIGESNSSIRQKLLELLKEKKMNEALLLVQDLVKQDKNLRLFVKSILEDLHKILITTVSKKDHPFKANSWKLHELKLLMDILSKSWTEYKTSVIPSLPLELAIIDYCQGEVQVKSISKTPSLNTSSAFKTFVSPDGSVGCIAEKWEEILQGLKSHNHSIVGVLRSCRPISLQENILTIESPYKFHAERISEVKTQKAITAVILDIVGVKVKIETVLKSA